MRAGHSTVLRAPPLYEPTRPLCAPVQYACAVNLTPWSTTREQRPTRPSLPLDPQEPIAIGALLIAVTLLRIGAVGTGLAVQFDLLDIAHGHPRGFSIGVVGAAQSSAEFLFALPLARAADRIGRTRFLVGGPLLGVVSIVLVALSGRSSQIATARILEGIGAAAFIPTALGTIAAATSRNESARALASGAFEGATLLGYIGGFIVGGTYHWFGRGVFVLLAALYVAAGAVCFRFVPRVKPHPVSSVRTIAATVLGPGPIRAFLPAWLCVSALLGAYSGNLPALLHRQANPSQHLVHHFDERIIASLLVSWTFTLVIGIIGWIPILQRTNAVFVMRRTVPGVFVLAAALFGLNHGGFVYIPLMVVFVVMALLWEAGFLPAAVTYLADCSEMLTNDRSALMGFYTVILAGGGALGALVGGLLADRFLIDGLIILTVALGGIAYSSLTVVARYERRRGVDSTGSG